MVELKRYAAPDNFPIARKVRSRTVMPRAGPHPLAACIPLQIIVRDVLKWAESGPEAAKILKSKAVLVDGRPRTDPRYPCGLMDVIEIPKTGEQFRVLPKRGRLIVTSIPKENAAFKLCQIKDKRTVRGNFVQLNLHDGRNILVKVKDAMAPKEAVEYKPGDTLKISLPDQKVVAHLPMKEGNIVMVSEGKHAGVVGRIKQLITIKGREPNKVVIDAAGKEVRTLRDYIFVIGKEKSEVMIPR